MLFIVSTTVHNEIFSSTIDVQPDMRRYGKLGEQAPELNIAKWVDKHGMPTDDILLANYADKVVVLYCFQAWCPGCHSSGLPSLKKIVDHFKGNEDVAFLAIQTVFEGSNANTYERMLEIQKEYELEIPFCHDDGSNLDQSISSTMTNYKTGGTPWFIIIDKKGKVVFNNFQIEHEYAKSLIENLHRP